MAGMASPLTVWASTADGTITGYHVSDYATARSTATSAATTSASGSIGQKMGAGKYYCYEGFYSFDTSSIDDTGTITTATFYLYPAADWTTTDFTIEARIRDWGASLTTADWVAGASLGDYTLVASYATSGGWTGAAYKTFTSETAFLTNVSKTGTTYIMTSSSRMAAGTTPSGDEIANEYLADDATGGGGTDRDPKLYVEWSMPVASSGYWRRSRRRRNRREWVS